VLAQRCPVVFDTAVQRIDFAGRASATSVKVIFTSQIVGHPLCLIHHLSDILGHPVCLEYLQPLTPCRTCAMMSVIAHDTHRPKGASLMRIHTDTLEAHQIYRAAADMHDVYIDVTSHGSRKRNHA